VGVIYDERADLKDISATIIDLACRGYLKIKEIRKKSLFHKKKDYLLILRKDFKNQPGLNDFEKHLLNYLFEGEAQVTLSQLKKDFYVHLKKLKKILYRQIVRKGYFPTNPERIRLWYRTTGLGTIVLGWVLISFLTLGLSLIVSGILILIFSRAMPRRTLKGVLIQSKILGFKWYLKVAEKERIKFHNAPEKRPDTFEHFLPYAMVLGVEKEWANQFKDIYQKPPSWYEGDFSSGFNSLIFLTALSDFSYTSQRTLAHAPGGRGGSGFSGGFSGGGFGGGGGGSW
jgi:uncharacterized membrane protein